MINSSSRSRRWSLPWGIKQLDEPANVTTRLDRFVTSIPYTSYADSQHGSSVRGSRGTSLAGSRGR